VQRGRWQRPHLGVYAAFTGEPGRSAILWAAVLRAGDEAMLSYQTAGELFGVTDRPSAAIHVTVPGARRVTRLPGIAVHVAARAGEARHPTLTPPRTRIEETVLDLAQTAATADGAYEWVTRALGRRLTTQARLTEALALRKRIRWRAELAQALTAEWKGVHSVLEYRLEQPHGNRQARVMRGSRSEYRDVR
jgi:hypothetical protein